MQFLNVKTGLGAQACDPSTQEVKAGRLVQGNPRLPTYVLPNKKKKKKIALTTMEKNQEWERSGRCRKTCYTVFQ